MNSFFAQSTTFRNEISYNNFSLKVLKSALQKYVRRGLNDKAYNTLLELCSFRNEKRIMTNVFHRLLIISVEDIGIVSPLLPIALYDFAKNFEHSSKSNSNNDDKSSILFRILFTILSVNDRCRVISDFKSFCFLPPCIVSNEFLRIYRNFFNSFFQGKFTFTHPNKRTLPNFLNLLDNFNFKNFNISDIYYTLSYFPLENNPKLINSVFNHINSNIINNKIFIHPTLSLSIKYLHYFAKIVNNKESILFLYNSLLLLFFNPLLSHHFFNDPLVKIANKIINKNINMNININKPSLPDNSIDFPSFYSKFSGNKLVLDDFVFDLHTGSKDGSKNGSKYHFALVSAFCKNDIVIDSQLRDFYQKFKLFLDEYDNKPHIEKLLFQFNVECKIIPDFTKEKLDKSFIRGQKLTAKYKCPTFIDTINHIVYKGPYLSDNKRLFNNVNSQILMSKIQKKLNINPPTFLPISYIIKNNNNEYFIVWSYFGPKIFDVINGISTKIESDISTINRTICSNIRDKLSDDNKIRILQHLYCCFLCNIGDFGDHNILYNSDNDQIVGIDLEEKRSKQNLSDNVYQLLFKNPPNNIRNFYPIKLLKKIKILDNFDIPFINNNILIFNKMFNKEINN